jgi:hypothetical protein
MPDLSNDSLSNSLSLILHDYRQGEIAAPTFEHINHWIEQFPQNVQEPMLKELNHVLSNTYLSKSWVLQNISGLLNNEKLTAANPAIFWKNANILQIQQGGSSQKDLLYELNQLLINTFGFGIEECGSDSGEYIYLDDFIFSGRRVITDFLPWIEREAPPTASIKIIHIGWHSGGKYYANRELEKATQAGKKQLQFQWWRALEFENRLAKINESDVLWLRSLPEEQMARDYEKILIESGHPPIYRSKDDASKFFSSEEGRNLLEHQFLLAGLHIRNFCQNPSEIMRPLGYYNLKTFGFGAMVVTYRNCPNNCPLSLWWGDHNAAEDHPFSKWYPLLPRKTYEENIPYFNIKC